MISIKFTACLVVVVLNSGLLNASLNSDGLKSVLNSRNLNTQDLISDDGYMVETHHVVTSDGYILELHRIPYGKSQTSASGPRAPVFMMHGLLAASQSYVGIGPELSSGYIIADAGFDVWLGNARGNRNSRAHVQLNPSDSEDKFSFFDFSWEEIATYDISAMIDYVLEHTGREKLHYIGHSQGGTVFLVLNSIMPEYNAKIASAHLLAGVGYQNHFPNRLLAAAADRVNTIYALALRLGIVEIFPPLSEWLPIGKTSDDCTGVGYPELCELMGVNELTNAGRIDHLVGIGFGGAAIKQVAHYGQNIKAKVFRRWDHGVIGNLAHYGALTPPPYDLSLINVNVTMHYTVGDVLLDERDVLAMVEVMPNAKARRVARDSFTHTDFIAAPDAKELFTDYIVETLIRDENAPSVVNPDHEDNVTEGEDNGVIDTDDNNNTSSSSMLSVGVVLNAYLLFAILRLSL